MDMVSEIQRRRVAADISQADLAYALGRSPAWVGGVERGILPITAETKDKILRAIERLAAHRAEVRRAREAIAEDNRLPKVGV